MFSACLLKTWPLEYKRIRVGPARWGALLTAAVGRCAKVAQ